MDVKLADIWGNMYTGIDVQDTIIVIVVNTIVLVIIVIIGHFIVLIGIIH